MKSKVQTKKLYCVFNLLFGILVLLFLGINIKKISAEELKLNTTIAYIIQVFGVAVFVHAIKALRLYIVLFGNKFSFRKYLGQYIKTAAVNLLLPFKCGEIYRGLCIGELIGTYAEGYIIVIFDRFVDTLALITMVILAGFLFGFEAAMYSIIFQFVSTQTINTLHRKDQKATMFIVTRHGAMLEQKIMECTRHGITHLAVQGCYLKEDKDMLYTVLGEDEVKEVTALVHSLDPEAFINIIKSEGIAGRFYEEPLE